MIPTGRRIGTFNRTSMELKQCKGLLGDSGIGSFNRTSMELKPFHSRSGGKTAQAF